MKEGSTPAYFLPSSSPTIPPLQLWLEFVQSPSSREQELLESVLKAWFMLGKLGGFNSSNLQAGAGGEGRLMAWFMLGKQGASELQVEGKGARVQLPVTLRNPAAPPPRGPFPVRQHRRLEASSRAASPKP